MIKNRLGGILGLLLLVPLLLLAGCATGSSYQVPETEYPSTSLVPPSYYDYNPQYEQWFTGPEWMPDVGP